MKKTSLSLLLSLASLLSAASQSAAPAPTHPAQAVTLGKSAAALTGPWKFTTGDSPIDPKTGQPLWADPAFDDSSWENVDLTSDSKSQNPINGISGFVPGWTARGHTGYWGYAWYRIRIRIHAEPGIRLALVGPSVDDGYQLFANGSNVGHFGDFHPRREPDLYYSQPMMFSLPSVPSDSSGTSTMVIAFRLYMQPQTLYEGQFVGGFESAPLLGEATTISLATRSQYTDHLIAYSWQPFEFVFLTVLGLLALSLSLADRSDRVYLWIGGLLLITAIDALSGTFSTSSTWVPARYDHVLNQLVLAAIEYVGWIMVWRVWFRQRRPAWMPWALIPLALALMLAQALVANYFPSLAGTHFNHIGLTLSLIVRIILAGFLIFIVVKAIREHGIEGWLALPALLFAVLAKFAQEINQAGLHIRWFPFGVQITLGVASRLLLVFVLAILLVRRLILSIRRQRLMALDVKQAQEVQQVILPESSVTVPGFAIESEYHPALEVGGDFFQIIPHPADGSVLIVAGDVAGKGLKAGMLVSLMVGAIRTAAEINPEPASILATLNRRLLGRGDARATCLALRIADNGRVVLANSGHMPPYLNDKELKLEGSLPLGLVENLDCSLLAFQMQPNDRLLLLSDGIAEATDEKGALFGFDRILDLLRTKPSAAQIAQAAQSFGQSDDISVIAVTRTLVAELIPA